MEVAIAMPDDNRNRIKLPIEVGDYSLLERLYGNVIEPSNEELKIEKLEEIVLSINEGQRKLDRIRKIDSSMIYRAAITVIDLIKKLADNKTEIENLYDLFDTQQDRVEELNKILGGMILHYAGDVQESRKKLDGLLEESSTYSIRKNELNGELPYKLDRVDFLKEEIKRISPDAAPETYYPMLKEIITIERTLRHNTCEYELTEIQRQTSKEKINHYRMQETIFETLLYGVCKIYKMTKDYQDLLRYNSSIFRRIENLGRAVASVSGGVEILSDFSSQMLEIYIETGLGIKKAIDEHPGPLQTKYTSNSLRNLVGYLISAKKTDINRGNAA